MHLSGVNIMRWRGSPQSIQLGVTSFSNKHCAEKDVPAVFIRVAAYMEWIRQNLEP